jgi:acyl-CoA thioester hydrolase
MHYPVSTTITVRFRDLDPMGHVNNAVYASYLEMARVAYIAALAKVQGRQTAMLENPSDLNWIVAELTIAYKSPAHLGEVLDVGIKLTSAGRTSFVFDYAVTEQQSGRLVATGRSVQVMYDYEQRHKMPVPDELLAAAAKLQGAPVSRS